MFKDKYNNIYNINKINNMEYLLEHTNNLIIDTPHKYYSEIKTLAEYCIDNKYNCSYSFYKNNKLVSFIYGYFIYNELTIRLFWFNNIKNSFIFLSLLYKYYLDILVKINIYNPYDEAKWYLFDNYFNNKNNKNYINYIRMTNHIFNNVNNLLSLYGIIQWDNTDKVK